MSYNSASSGGAIYNEGSLTTLNVTLASNLGQGGANLQNEGIAALTNTILNTGYPGSCGGAGSLTSGGHNIDSDGTCVLSSPGDQSQTEPLLGVLAANGGPVRTHRLLPDSPAIDAANDAACPSTDAREIVRPLDGDGDGMAHCDIGAYELAPDLDLDGCTDLEVVGPSPALGGQRNPLSFWDLMSVFTGNPLVRDSSVSGGDISAIVQRFGSNDATPGAFDRNSDPLSTPSKPVMPSGARANYHPS
jgi:hypothetical protein